MKLHISAAAEADLENITSFIARDNPARAITFLSELHHACTKIVEMPLAYQLVSRYESHGIRRRVQGNYLIFYVIDAESVSIIHVLHGARDFEPLLD